MRMVLLLCLLWGLWGCSWDMESESNGSIELADEIEGGVLGRMEGVEDRDYYRYRSEGWKVVRVLLGGVKGLDLKLEVYRGEELIKRVDDHYRGSGEWLENLEVLGGKEYYFVVSLGVNSGVFLKDLGGVGGVRFFPSERYELRVEEIKEVKGVKGSKSEEGVFEGFLEELEPNDGYGSANWVGIGSVRRGYYSPFYEDRGGDGEGFEEDWYRIEGGLGRRVGVLMSGEEGVDGVLDFYKGCGEGCIRKFMEVDGNGEGLGEEFRNLYLEGGEYYIVVKGIPRGYGLSVGRRYGYELEVFFEEEWGVGVEIEKEGNGDFESANGLNIGFTRGILTVGDRDYYWMDLRGKGREGKKGKGKKGMGRVFWVNGEDKEGGLDLKLWLYNGERELLRVYNGNGEGLGEEVRGYDMEGLEGIYLVVGGGVGGGGGYELEVGFRSWEFGKEELEPNEWVMGGDLGNGLEVGEELEGVIDYMEVKEGVWVWDRDSYGVELGIGKKYEVRLRSLSEGGLRLRVYHGLDYGSWYKELEVGGLEGKGMSFEELGSSHSSGGVNGYRVEVMRGGGKGGEEGMTGGIYYKLLIREKG